jgi:hypothetical protein
LINHSRRLESVLTLYAAKEVNGGFEYSLIIGKAVHEQQVAKVVHELPLPILASLVALTSVPLRPT